ncbi:MAG: two component regulator propeller [Phycisphaerales bacterium]|nr:two component regulator propeller [Phycisphaerales bacterium]
MRFAVLFLIGLLPLLAHAVDVTEQATAAPLPWDRKVNFVLSAARDARSGKIWVGTEEAGAWCYDGKGWTTYTTKNGLGDDNVFALAVDEQGRVWAGHVNHGVSVFDGKSWKNYDAMTGPLGSRVFAIKVCSAGPRAGEVWIASDGGLARYWPKDDAWSYVTRAEGLPADQVQCIAFDIDGRVIVGTQCDGLAIATPADDYAMWTTVPGPTRPGTEPEGDGLPSCMINDVLVSREGAIYVATPWGLGKSTDGGKTFRYRRGTDWAAKTKQRTGGKPADFKEAPEAALLAEDYVTCLTEDAMGLLWIGYRSAGYEAVDEPNQVSRHAGAFGPGPGKAGECAICILPLIDGGPLVGTYGSGLLQSEKYFTGEGAMRLAPLAAREVAAHPAPAKAPGGLAVDKMRARLAVAAAPNAKSATAAFLGDDWTTQGDGIGRYGRQIYSLPFYGPGGWSQQYKCDVHVGPHQNKNKGGPYTYYHTIDAQSPRVLYIPNSGKRNQGEWNDGSFDRDAYSDTWEGPDLWIDVAVPAGAHRLSLYFINYDAHGLNNRRRDFLVEVKAKAASLAEADFAPALAKARVVQFYHGVYKQFILAGPAEYHVKVGRNYSLATKVSGIFLDRLEGPVPPHEPSGVPIMGEAQVKPPDVIDPRERENVAIRAAAEITSMLDKSWSRGDALALQRPYRMLALRLAAEQGGGAALLANWRFAIPLMNAADHQDFVRTVAVSRELMLDRNPNMIDTPLRASMAAAWKKLQKPIAAGDAPDPATLTRGKVNAADPAAIHAALIPYLILRAGVAIDTRSLSTDGQTLGDYIGEFKGVAKDRKALYRLTGEYLLYSDALAQRKGEKSKRQALASALAVNQACLELLDDTWLAARMSEALLVPQIKNATVDDGPLSRKAVMAAIVAAHTDDPEGLKVLQTRLDTGHP